MCCKKKYYQGAQKSLSNSLQSASLNRREALKLIGAGIFITYPSTYAFAGLQFPLPDDAKDFDVVIDIYRPEDMLILRLAYENVEFLQQDSGTFLVKKKRKRPSTLTAIFPSQAVMEEAYYERNSNTDKDNEAEIPPPSQSDPVIPPAQIYRSGRSRLVYQIPDEDMNIPLTIPYLLDWSTYKMVIDSRAFVNEPVHYKPEFAKNNLFFDKFDDELIKKLPDKYQSIVKADESQQVKMVPSRELKIKRKSKNARQVQQDQTTTISKADKNNFLQISPKTREKILLTNPKYTNQIEKASAPENIKYILPQATGVTLDADKLVKVLKEPGPLSIRQTAIEAPAWVFISPNQNAGFNYTINPASYLVPVSVSKQQKLLSGAISPVYNADKEIFELWHARLGVKRDDGEIDEYLFPYKTFRVLWARDAKEKINANVRRNWPFRASLDESNRHKLVHQTSNFASNFKPKAVRANKLMLSSLGAYMDFWGDLELTEKNKPSDLNLLLWEHRANLGRDNYVKIVEEGHLFPFGHRAALVKVTERKIDAVSNTAALKQRMYIVIMQPVVTYQPRNSKNEFIPFPFQSVELLTTVTPDIDKVENVPGNNSNSRLRFWVTVNQKRFPFACKSIDKEGKEHFFDAPIIFVELSVAKDQQQLNLLNDVANAYPQGINSTGGASANVPMLGQKIALAESLAPEDTTFAAVSMLINGEILNQDGNLNFYPIMVDARIRVSAIAELTNDNSPITITLEDDQQSNNRTAMFAKIVSENNLDFNGNADSAGGLFNPNLSITGLNKIQGPVGGNVADMALLDFKPQDFFLSDLTKGPMAKLFGVIPIFELLKAGVDSSITSTIDNVTTTVKGLKQEIDVLKMEKAELMEQGLSLVDKQAQIDTLVNAINNELNSITARVPNLKSYTTATAAIVEYRWQPEMKGNSMDFFNFVTLNVADKNNAVNIETRVETPFNHDAPRTSIASSFIDFDVEILDIIAIKFAEIRFNSGTGQKSDVKVAMKNNGITFMGPLKFVNSLEEVIPIGGFADGPEIDVQPSGITAGYSIEIPAVEAGMLSIKNIALGASVELPFTGEPLAFNFNFCKRENPFLLTVSAFGGGGFFALGLTSRGLVAAEASFEFGASISINLGVASGGVSVMGGFYYAMEVENDNSITILTGYIRLNGSLSILGLITLALEFYLALTYIIESGKADKLIGEATMKVKVEVLCFSKTVSITARRTLKGANADPVFADTITQQDWIDYTSAFALA